MKCSVCGVREAVVLQRHTGRALCKECFFDDVVSRVRKEVTRFNMFSDRDRLLLALSGGKDSFVLLDVMLKLHNPSKLGIVTIIEGIPGYNREEDIEWIKEASRKYGIELHLTSIKDYVGYSLGELVTRADELGVVVSPCTFCGVSRRRIINEVARELGYDRVLTAHNLDDEAQTALMNILRGDVLRLVQTHPAGPVLSHLFVRKVKPLRKIYEEEITSYAYLKSFRFQQTECPYIRFRPTLRAMLRGYLFSLERKSPGTLLRFLENVDDLVSKLVPKYSVLPELPRCERCGEPTAFGRRYCILCDLLTRVGIETIPRVRLD